jgi:hypothetical protein
MAAADYPSFVSIMVIEGGARLALHDSFLRYMNVMRRTPEASWNDPAATEVFNRLQRLRWLEWEVRTRDLEVRNPFTSNERGSGLMVEIPTLTEAWYSQAFRAMRMIKGLPHLGSFEISAVTLTRNKLIEHDNGIFNANVALGETGPRVKGPRWDGQSEEWPDQGLFATAEEFYVKLDGLLNPYVIRDIQEDMAARGTPLPSVPASADPAAE